MVRWWIGAWNLPFITSSLLLWSSSTGKLFDLTGLEFFLRIMFMSLFLLYSSRNDCRRRRSEREKVINFRQKEKDILDSIIGMSLIFYPKNHKNIQERKQRELQATTQGSDLPPLTQWQMKQVGGSQKYSIRIHWSVFVSFQTPLMDWWHWVNKVNKFQIRMLPPS